MNAHPSVSCIDNAQREYVSHPYDSVVVTYGDPAGVQEPLKSNHAADTSAVGNERAIFVLLRTSIPVSADWLLHVNVLILNVIYLFGQSHDVVRE